VSPNFFFFVRLAALAGCRPVERDEGPPRVVVEERAVLVEAGLFFEIGFRQDLPGQFSGRLRELGRVLGGEGGAVAAGKPQKGHTGKQQSRDEPHRHSRTVLL